MGLLRQSSKKSKNSLTRKAKVEFHPPRQAILLVGENPTLGLLTNRTFLCYRIGHQTHIELCLKQASNFYERLWGQSGTTYFPRCKNCPILAKAVQLGGRGKPKRKAKKLARSSDVDAFTTKLRIVTGRGIVPGSRQRDTEDLDLSKFIKKNLKDGTIVYHPIQTPDEEKGEDVV